MVWVSLMLLESFRKFKEVLRLVLLVKKLKGETKDKF